MITDVSVSALRVAAFRIPTEELEADGSLHWDANGLVLVELEAGGKTGLGYTYADAAAARLIDGLLRERVEGCDPLNPARVSAQLWASVRDVGRAGIAASAISALDIALWDLKARLLDLPLAVLLGRQRDSVAVYGSGGFISYDDRTLRDQLGRWAEEDGCRWVKMKICADPERELARITDVLEGIGEAMLLVDADGAYDARQAISLARHMANHGIGWFEEPVRADDRQGLQRVRQALDSAGVGMDVAAGEYACTPADFRELLAAQAVDVLQADLTRCGGVTGFLRVAALCEAFQVDLSSHGAPALHLPVACAVQRLRHVEWFHDHVRLEAMLFDGAPTLQHGWIAPDLAAPGHGLSFKHADAAPYAV